MQKRKFSNILPLVIALAFAAVTIAAMSSSNYSIETSILSSGGGFYGFNDSANDSHHWSVITHRNFLKQKLH